MGALNWADYELMRSIWRFLVKPGHPYFLAIMAKKMRRINKDEKKPLFLFSKFICLKCKR